jgi:hypothetical protein
MAADELLAELAEQVNAGVEFDTEFSEATPVEDLRELVKVGRKALKEGDSEEGSDEDTSEDSEESGSEEGQDDGGSEDGSESDARVEIKTATKLTVVCVPMSKTRDYSEASHGPLWRTLAKQYVENMHHKGIKATIVAH